jgi:hypothetical protein
MTTTDIYQAIAAFIGSITWSDVEAWLAYFGALLAVCTMLAAASLRGAKALHAYALTTPTKSDEKVTAVLVRIAEVAGAALAFVAAWLPRITVGLGDARRTLDAVKLPKPPRGAGALLILLVVLPLTSYSSGCATTEMQRARQGVGFGLEAMHAVDDVFDPRYRAAQARVASGEVPENEVDAFIRRWNAAAYSIVGAVAALRTAETTLDAIEAGQAGDIRSVLSCVGVAIIGVIDKLPSVGVEIPELVDVALRFVMALVGTGSSCEPEDHASAYEVPHVSMVLQ